MNEPKHPDRNRTSRTELFLEGASERAPEPIALRDPDHLITRLVDGEADARDADSFTTLADREPGYWRELGIRQCDMARLRDGLDQSVPGLAQLELPAPAGAETDRRPASASGPPDSGRACGRAYGRAYGRSSGGRLWITLSGWAAAFLLLLGGGVFYLAGNSARDFRAGEAERPEWAQSRLAAEDGRPRLSPQQHYRAYLGAPFVVGELDPILLEVEERPDGQLEIRFLRRIEEVLRISPGEDLPMDSDGRFREDPAELRKNSGLAPDRQPDRQ